MRINHNVAAMVAANNLSLVSRDLDKSIVRLSTGLRINSSGDDVAGLAVSEKLRSQVRGLAVAQRSAQDGMSLLQIADSASGEINTVLQRMRELAVQSVNDGLTNTERGYLQSEVSSLIAEVDRIAGTTTYGTQTLLDGTLARGTLMIGVTGSRTDMVVITVTDIDATALAINATTVATAGGASAALTSIDAAINSVNAARSTIGAVINRLDHALNNLVESQNNVQAAESNIRDADFATETALFSRHQIISQSSIAMLAQANQIPAGVLALIGR
jgi:flagellin